MRVITNLHLPAGISEKADVSDKKLAKTLRSRGGSPGNESWAIRGSNRNFAKEPSMSSIVGSPVGWSLRFSRRNLRLFLAALSMKQFYRL